MKARCVVAALCLALYAHFSQAAITNALFDASFELQTGNTENQTVSNWFESSKSANFNDWVKSGTVDPGQFPAAQSNVVNFSNPNGFIYQMIGTYAGEAAVDISGKAIRRYPNAQRAFRPFSISIYQTATNVNGATGVHPSGLSGSTLIAAVNVSDVELGLTGNYSAPQMTNFIKTLPLTTATTGRRLWLAFTALAGNDETGLDDLAITVNTNYVPPPPPGPIAYDTVQVLSNSDSAAVIVEKAAKLLPRTNQVAWMRLEETFFVHFSVDTFNGVELGTGQESPSVFNPSNMDPNQWIREIRNAGGKQLVLVVKHHDGFCLWPSRYTTQSVASSVWMNGAGNVVRQVADAAHAQGLKLGFYLSPADLYQLSTNPSNLAGYYGDGSSNTISVIPTDPASFKTNPATGRTPTPGFTNYSYAVDDYNRYFLNQLYELLTEYGPVSEVWFDGANPTAGANQTYAYQAWYDLIRHLQPDAVIFGKGPDARWVGNENGTARTNEWSVIPLPLSPDIYTWPDLTANDLGSRSKLTPGSYLWWYPAEADAPILSGWFWASNKTVKTPNQLLTIYNTSVGRNANLILNLSPDIRGLVPDNQLASLRQMGQIINNTYASNLAVGATVTADTANSNNPAAFALDGDLDTWWEAATGQTNGTLTITMPTNFTFDTVALQEAVAQRSQRIETFSVDTWNGSVFITATNMTTIGHKRLVLFTSPITTSQVRIRVTGSRLEPTLARVGLFKQAAVITAPVISNRDSNGFVTLSTTNGLQMVFTLDGTLPTTGSAQYSGPIAVPLGGTLLANCLSVQGQLGMLTSKTFAGWTPGGWTIVATDSQETILTNAAAAMAIDGNPATFWSTRSNFDLVLPHFVTVDMAAPRWIGGLTYLPRQDGISNGIVAQYRFETSVDGTNWTTNVTTGTFYNQPGILDVRSVNFPPVKARYFRFTALSEINGNGWTTAAELSVLPAGFDDWRSDFGLQTNAPASDPNADGVPLLMDYFRGVAPGTATNAPLVAVGADANTFYFDVRRWPGRYDLTQGYDVSTNLVNWGTAVGVVTNSTTQEIDGTETQHLSMPRPAGGPAFFLRLVISQN